MKFGNIIKEMKQQGKGLMSFEQYIAAGLIVDILSPCNFLIFGLGQDAETWKKINDGGRTVFIEDDKEWIEKFSKEDFEIYTVEYNTLAKDYKEIGFDTEKLRLDLPPEITDTKWDVVFVDGPLGHNPPRDFKGPGRMKSIYAAHTLLREGGMCIIDDVGREIESNYSLHFFGQENVYNIVEDKLGIFKKRER